MKRDYSNVPTSKVVKNITEDKIKFDLRDNWKQVPVEIEPNDSIEITVETSEAMALLEAKVEELGLEMTDGGTTPVEVPVESVSLNENTANLFVGQTLTLVATITPNNATNKQCTWSSTDDSKATVVDGVVTAKAAGNVVISVKTVDGNKTASCDVTITIAEVADETSLRDVITNGATEVKLTDNITVPSGNLDVTGVEHFDGNNKTITFNTTGQNFVARSDSTLENVVVENVVATEDWSSTYGIQCYNGTYTIKNCTAKGGNAGILVNSSNVTLEGTIDVSSNKFGGIEVSKGSASGLGNSTLNVNGATILNSTEEYGKPTIWTDGEGQTVIGVESMYANSDVKPNQVQYYLEEANSVAPVDYSASITIPEGTTDVLGKQVSELQDSVSILDNAVSGTLNYVEGYTGFSSASEQQEGNYLVIHVENENASKITCQISDATVTPDELTLDSDGLFIARLTANTQTITVRTYSDDSTVKDTVVLDLTGLTLSEKA